MLGPLNEWRRLLAAARPSLKQLLLSERGRGELVVPIRDQARRRPGTCQVRSIFLLDTNVISELRRPKPHGAVLAWFEAVEDAQIYLSAVSLGEIQAGIELTRAQDEAKASQIAAWLELGLRRATCLRWTRLPSGLGLG